MTKLLLAATTALALTTIPAMASWYDVDESCDGGEGISSIGNGEFTIYETSYFRLTPLKSIGDGAREAIYEGNSEGEPLGKVRVISKPANPNSPTSDWFFSFPDSGDMIRLYYCGE